MAGYSTAGAVWGVLAIVAVVALVGWGMYWAGENRVLTGAVVYENNTTTQTTIWPGLLPDRVTQTNTQTETGVKTNS